MEPQLVLKTRRGWGVLRKYIKVFFTALFNMTQREEMAGDGGDDSEAEGDKDMVNVDGLDNNLVAKARSMITKQKDILKIGRVFTTENDTDKAKPSGDDPIKLLKHVHPALSKANQELCNDLLTWSRSHASSPRQELETTALVKMIGERLEANLSFDLVAFAATLQNLLPEGPDYGMEFIIGAQLCPYLLLV